MLHVLDSRPERQRWNRLEAFAKAAPGASSVDVAKTLAAVPEQVTSALEDPEAAGGSFVIRTSADTTMVDSFLDLQKQIEDFTADDDSVAEGVVEAKNFLEKLGKVLQLNGDHAGEAVACCVAQNGHKNPFSDLFVQPETFKNLCRLLRAFKAGAAAFCRHHLVDMATDYIHSASRILESYL